MNRYAFKGSNSILPSVSIAEGPTLKKEFAPLGANCFLLRLDPVFKELLHQEEQTVWNRSRIILTLFQNKYPRTALVQPQVSTTVTVF